MMIAPLFTIRAAGRAPGGAADAASTAMPYATKMPSTKDQQQKLCQRAAAAIVCILHAGYGIGLASY
jgi:hypothetical protein